jgi:hypothetical protein
LDKTINGVRQGIHAALASLDVENILEAHDDRRNQDKPCGLTE